MPMPWALYAPARRELHDLVPQPIQQDEYRIEEPLSRSQPGCSRIASRTCAARRSTASGAGIRVVTVIVSDVVIDLVWSSSPHERGPRVRVAGPVDHVAQLGGGVDDAFDDPHAGGPLSARSHRIVMCHRLGHSTHRDSHRCPIVSDRSAILAGCPVRSM